MALIECPECKKQISDKSKQCIHCGYPLEEYENIKINENHNLYKIQLIDYRNNETTVVTHIMRVSNIKIVESTNLAKSFKPIIMCGLSKDNADVVKGYFYRKNIDTEIIPDDDSIEETEIYFDSNDILRTKTKINLTQPQQPQSQNIPKCPTCGSTNIRKIGTGERAASVIGLGLLSKKINKTWKCNSCGHTW